jgi:hypothetical protein
MSILMNKMIRFGALVLLLAGLSFPLGAQVGKIEGRVVSQQTKAPIPGVNILIEGTVMGGAADADGRYIILNVRPGIYSIRASAIGFQTVTMQDVRVSIDLTTRIDFELSEAVLDLGEDVIVIAERPLIQKDVTAKTAVIDRDQLNALPVTEYSQVLSLQAGWVAGSLRGGRSGEVAYWIDGIPVTDVYDGSQVVEVNKNLIQEMQLVSGAFNAEYGQAMSGIVNIATREPGRQFTGGVSMYSGDYISNASDLFPGITRVNPTAIRNVDFNLSGPVIGDKVGFFVNGRYIFFGGYLNGVRRFNPRNIAYTDSTGAFVLFRDEEGVGDGEYVQMNWSERYYMQGKLTWRIGSLLKLNYNYIYDNTTSKAYSRMYFYNPDGIGNNYNLSNTHILQLTHTLSQRTFYTIGASLFERDFQYYLYENAHDPRYVHPLLMLQNDPYSYYTGGTDMNRFHRQTRTGLVKADISSQIGRYNLVKLGVEVRFHRLYFRNISLTPVQEQIGFDLAHDDPFVDTEILDVSSMRHDRYTRQPREYSAYIQDKLEFDDFILNVGVRFDYFEPDGFVLNDDMTLNDEGIADRYTVDDPNIFDPIKPWNRVRSLEERQTYWYKKAEPKYQVSPRIGGSFPITERGVLYFSYGHFFQIPRFERLYENPFFKIGSGTGNQGIVGNADLKPEQTINAEIGLQQQLADDIAADLTVYMRDIRNLTGTRADEIVIFGGSARYSRYVNSDFGWVRGVVLTVTKRFSGGLAATLDYTFQVARGTASNPQAARNAIAGGELPEVQLTPLDWDQRHTANVTMAYTQRNYGVSFIAQYGTGTPYTPRRSVDITTLLTNSQVKPTFFNVDAMAHYAIEFNPLRFVLFARAFNLLDIRNEVGVFNDTGRAGFTIDKQRISNTNPPERVNTIDQWFTIPTHYSEPRRIEIGVNIEF